MELAGKEPVGGKGQPGGWRAKEPLGLWRGFTSRSSHKNNGPELFCLAALVGENGALRRGRPIKSGPQLGRLPFTGRPSPLAARSSAPKCCGVPGQRGDKSGRNTGPNGRPASGECLRPAARQGRSVGAHLAQAGRLGKAQDGQLAASRSGALSWTIVLAARRARASCWGADVRRAPSPSGSLALRHFRPRGDELVARWGPAGWRWGATASGRLVCGRARGPAGVLWLCGRAREGGAGAPCCARASPDWPAPWPGRGGAHATPPRSAPNEERRPGNEEQRGTTRNAEHITESRERNCRVKPRRPSGWLCALHSHNSHNSHTEH